MIENRFTSKIFTQTQIDDFRLRKIQGSPENTYQIPRFFPHLRSLRRQIANREGRLQITPKESEYAMLRNVFKDAEEMGLEMGRKDPAVSILRASGLIHPDSKDNPILVQDGLMMRINDGKGNDVIFHLTYDMHKENGEGQVFHELNARIERAKIDGKDIPLTYEMHADGFRFSSHNMPTILDSNQTDNPLAAFVRQETPCHSCFIDGHRSSGGNTSLGCNCIGERNESLKIIYENGGVNCLIPGTGNGNGTKAQDRQQTFRSASERLGLSIIPYQKIYEGQGKKPDGRGDALAISTLIMEHLFRFKELPVVTALTDSSTKINTWKRFNTERVVNNQPLVSAKRDNQDFAHKREAHGYIAPAD